MENYNSALIIKQPHITNILLRKKIWEIRGSKTNIRGLIGLIEAGTKTIVGECEVIDCIGPLSPKDYLANEDKHLAGKFASRYKKTYAWVLSDVKRYEEPIPYEHPPGAQIWVKV